ncbi:MAG: hypothetical protein QNJ22_10110 [Desulfosarcinaceae bacterium]|nr:hypothetical protein [Desulfosarcinaceae bacterium]
MTLFKRQALWSLLALLLLGGAAHFYLNAAHDHRTQRDQLERIQFRQAFVRRQIAELQHKVKVIEQVNRFANGAENLGLLPSNWTRYEVNLEAPLRFPALIEILRQCTSTPYYYFQPDHMKIHLAGQHIAAEGADAADGSAAEAGQDSDTAGDLFLKLKGTFLARQR